MKLLNTKKGKIAFVIALLLILGGAVGCYAFLNQPKHSANPEKPQVSKPAYVKPVSPISSIKTNGVTVNFRATNDYFYNLKDGVWDFSYVKGVNMGLTLPDTDLNNPNISYATYIKWFSQISAMNANTVRVFTVMNPDFYKALYDYNKSNKDNSLYLVQGIWFNENYMYEQPNAFSNDKIITKSLKRAERETVDIIHGKSDYTSYGKIKKAVYKWDVSKYVTGYIIGLEWYPDFVTNTNKMNKQIKKYNGKYLYTEKASPFEVFLCEAGDYLIKYETEKFKHQAPLAFLNWSSTDPLKHSNEPFPEEDAVSVDTENIKSSKDFLAGQFAAVDAYPYYPEFVNYQPEYVSYKDEQGKSNPYRAYIRDLKKHYKMPLMIAEFGVPTSRGVAHSSSMGYNQGGITEKQQGEYISDMIKSIALEKCAGGLIFEWQDEWFKQTWNTVKYGPEKSTQRTPNVQSAEQSYGLLAFEAGKKQICKIDANFNDWLNVKDTFKSQELSVKTMEDEAYLYVNINTNQVMDASRSAIRVPIGITGRGSNQMTSGEINFSSPADFVVEINGKGNSKVLTDIYYDTFYYRYSYERGVFPKLKRIFTKNSGTFGNINQFLSNEIVLPLDGKTIDPVKYESGLLEQGADIAFSGSSIELRIPWYVLNVVNPAEKMCIGDFWTNKAITFEKFKDIKIGATIDSKTVNMAALKFQGFKKVSYHARLKQSYQEISTTYAEVYAE